MSKFVTLDEAVSHIKDNCSLFSGGFGSLGCPEELYSGIRERFEREGHPQNITYVCSIASGDKTESTEPYKGLNLGANKLAIPGLLGKVWAGNLTDTRLMAYMIDRNEIPGYLVPMGVMCNLFRCSAGGRPGLITKVGLHTFADPRQDGCAFNQKAKDGPKVVELMEIDGEEYLFYKAPRADVALIRATYADEDGNLSMEHEAYIGTELEVAVAAHNNGGIVIAQVEQVVPRGTLKTRNIRIHNKLVDYIVVAKDPMNSRQCYATLKYRPELSGEQKFVGNSTQIMPMTLRKIIARRAAMELQPNIIINLGTGLPSGVGSVAAEEGIDEGLTCSVESGPLGGQVQEGASFPGVANAECMFTQTDTIDMYDGGMLDMAFLGGAEIDENGNVNVSKFGGRSIGPGGYIDISQNAHKVFFMGTFTVGKPDIEITGSGLNIKTDGGVKFVKKVQQITFSADFARKHGQEIKYITERAVFRLCDTGLELVEIAPGVDLERDILGKMDFKPAVSPTLKLMDARLFNEAVMGIQHDK